MPSFKLCFSGEIRKSEARVAGGKQLVELQICRKNYHKDGEEPTFTWIKVNVWEPKEWQLHGFATGKYVAGVGEFTLRSYEKDGQKRQAAEVRCTSYDIDVPKPGDGAGQAPAPAAKPVPASADGEPPW